MKVGTLSLIIGIYKNDEGGEKATVLIEQIVRPLYFKTHLLVSLENLFR